MNLFDRKTSFFILLFCLPLLFIPKINILRVSEGETAGLRIDDFILLGFSVLLFSANIALQKQLLPIEKIVLGIVALSFVSFFSNRILVAMGVLHLTSKIFYCVRILEYFLFFYIGIIASRFLSSNKLIGAFFVWNVLLMILQKLGFLGEFNSSEEGYRVTTYRVSGIASFPSEMGALLNMIFCYYLFSPHSLIRFSGIVARFFRATSSYWLFLLFAVLVIITGSRIALAAMFVPFLFKLKQSLSLRSLSSLLAISCFIVGVSSLFIYLIFQTESLTDRSKGLLSLENIALVEKVWDLQDVHSQEAGERLDLVAYKNYDLSWWMRIHKWGFALKTYLYNPECYLQGLGPGVAWTALDGGLLRIVVEYGIIGVVLFWTLFRNIYRRNEQLQWVVIVLLINMIFFDVYLAYKPMSLLFLMAGYNEQNERKYWISNANA